MQIGAHALLLTRPEEATAAPHRALVSVARSNSLATLCGETEAADCRA